MQKIGIPQIHIIPFDLGAVFYDVLTIDNTKNLEFTISFCDDLQKEIESKGWTVKKLFTTKGGGKGRNRIPLTIDYLKDKFVDQAICRVEIQENLVCYVLSSGIGVFVFADLNCDALCDTDKSIEGYSKAMIANLQKKVSQATILNHAQFPDVFPNEEEKMLLFRRICWELIAKGVKNRKIKHLRPFSGREDYKSAGLSYVLTIYLMKKDELTQNEKDHLLCSSFFSNVVNPSNWQKINEKIMKNEPKVKSPVVECGSGYIYPAWSAVAIETSLPMETMEDLRNNPDLAALIKVESYVQSRWFVADNSMDNVNKNAKATMESLQRIGSLMEFYQAELENEISANMGTTQKNILTQVVETSEVKKLYKSVLSQIKTQLKIKEAHYQDKKSRNRLVADLFLAVFTASSLYKTVMDIVHENYTWVNSLIFGAMVLLAIGTIIFNYKNK